MVKSIGRSRHDVELLLMDFQLFVILTHIRIKVHGITIEQVKIMEVVGIIVKLVENFFFF